MTVHVSSLRYPADGARVAVDDLSVADGERLIVFGPNGSGKTTLLRLLAGTLPGGPALPCAYLPQRPFAFRGSARWNLQLGLSPSGRGRAVELADRFGVGPRLDRPVSTLSGGERQRLALARTLARPEELVLLDEPLAAIDHRDRMAVAALIVETLAGRTMVAVTHDREETAALGERIAVMVDGRVLQVGSIREVFALPAGDAVADATGIGNVLDGRVVKVDGPLVALEAGPITVWGVGDVDVGDAGRALFGAETVIVYAEPHPDAGSARNVWSGRVASMQEMGRLVEVVVDVGVRVAALVTPGSRDALRLDSGAPVTVALKATAVRILPG